MLDPRFGKVIAKMRSTTHEGERAAARGRAEVIAAGCGMTLEQALAELERTADGDVPARRSIFKDFDDLMEAEHPGWKAEKAAEHAKRRRQWEERQASILARFNGDEDAALAPCEREKLLIQALRPFIVPREPPFSRWTDSLDGWDGGLVGPSERVKEAAREAYPMPTTFQEALAEHTYWRERASEMFDVFGFEQPVEPLDLVAQVRANLVSDLAERDIPVSSIVDVYERMKLYHEREGHNGETEAAIFRDLEQLAKREQAQAAQTAAPDPSTVDIFDAVRDALRVTPHASDRHIARAVGCSPTTVGKLRRELGMSGVERSVHRRGQTYRMKAGERTL